MKPQDLGQCSACQRSFKAGQQIYESPEDKRTLCEACYLSAAPKCAACLMPVVGTVARVGESAYHPECLVCSGCRLICRSNFAFGQVFSPPSPESRPLALSQARLQIGVQ
eukprot:g16280.t1